MKTKLNISPKTATKVGIKNTVIYFAAGLGVLAILFVGAFFYFNLGNTEKAQAATEIKTVRDGNWSTRATWDNTMVIRDGLKIIVNHKLIVTSNEKMHKNRVHIEVYGTLDLDNGKIDIGPGSTIVIHEGATVISNKGESDQITINGKPWKGAQINFKGPMVLNEFGETILPIVLEHFDASFTVDNTVQVAWGTYSEKNNDFFTLERSIDGKNFEVLATIDGAGNSNKKLSYSYEDTNPGAGMNYYRLKQTDFNGDFEYFKIVGVNNKLGVVEEKRAKDAIHIGKVWPNPFTDQMNINFEVEMDGEVEVIIQNAMGQIIHKDLSPSFYGENSYVFEKGMQLEAGVYYVTLSQDGKKYKTQRVVKI